MCAMRHAPRYDCDAICARSIAWRLHGSCLEAAWKLPGSCLEAAWKLPGSCLEAAWKLHAHLNRQLRSEFHRPPQVLVGVLQERREGMWEEGGWTVGGRVGGRWVEHQ
jgi:hypothetical protein